MEQAITLGTILAQHPAQTLEETIQGDILSIWPNFPISDVQSLIFLGQWQDYEENGEVCIYISQNGDLTMIETGYSVMADNTTTEQTLTPVVVTPQEAFETIQSY